MADESVIKTMEGESKGWRDARWGRQFTMVKAYRSESMHERQTPGVQTDASI